MAINLLPWREQQAVFRNRKFYLLAIMIAGCILLTSIATQHYLHHLQRLQSSKNQQLAVQINDWNKNDALLIEKRNQIIMEQIQLIEKVMTNQRMFWRQLTLLQQKLPADIQLNQWDWSPLQSQLRGSTTQTDQLSFLIRELIQSPLFTAVVLTEMIQPPQQPMMQFTLQMQNLSEQTNE